MKTFTSKILVFVFIIYLFDKPLGYMISELVGKKQFDNRIEKLFSKEIDQDIIILGSSRAINDISPEIIQKETNHSAYNLGFSGSNLLFHESIFKLLIYNYIPKKIILTLDEQSSFIATKKSIYRNDKLRPFLNFNQVRDEYLNHSSKSKISAKISWTYRENQNFIDALEYLKSGRNEPDMETTNINEFGAVLIPSDTSFLKEPDSSKMLQYYQASNEDKRYLESFSFIIKKCKELNIELFVIRLPVYKTKLIGINERIKNIIQEDAIFVDLSNSISEKTYFFDNGHLNENGAKEFSKILSNKINQWSLVH